MMHKRSLIAFAEELRAAPDLESYWTRSNAELAKYGVESVFYAALQSRIIVNPSRITQSLFWKTSHPREFLETFGAETVLDGEFTVQQAVASPQLFFWHDPAQWKDATPLQLKRAATEIEMGLHVGATISAMRFGRGNVGGIGVSTRSIKDVAFEKFWGTNGEPILDICSLLDVGMRQRHLSEMIALSPREKDCMTYLALGLRPGQIADRLGIGIKSVDKYIAGAKKKLRATTRDQAVAIALLFNVIQP